MGGYDQALLLGRAAVGASGFRFIAPSRPGYLGTPFNRERTPENQAELCGLLLDALSIRDTTVIAISGGGQCALQFALRYPDRCRDLVMISACSAPLLSVRIPWTFQLMRIAARIPVLAAAMHRRAVRHPDESASRSIPDAELCLRTLNHPEAGPLMRELQLGTLARLAARLPGTRNDIEQSRQHFSYPVERIHAPTLIVHGTMDEAVPFADAELLASRIRGAKMLTIDGGRHVSLFTHLDLIRARVRAFLGT